MTALPPYAAAAVAQLDRLVHAGRRAGRDGGAADGARLEQHVDLDGRVAARVEDLAGVDVRRSRLIRGLLGVVEVAVLLLERQRAPILAVLARELLGSLDAAAEALRRAAQLELGIDVELARDVDRGEQHVAELLGAALGRVEVVLQLAQLVVEVGDRAVDVRVLEADRLRALLHLARVEQRRQRLGHVVEDALAPLLLALDPLPVLLHAPGVSASTSPNTCGCRRTSFSWISRAAVARSPLPRSSSRSARK